MGKTSDVDLEIAKRVRDLAGLNPSDGTLADDITYSSADDASPFAPPFFPNPACNDSHSLTSCHCLSGKSPSRNKMGGCSC